eukprot:52354-Prorocentrum_minimum.AAC.2
MHRRVGWSTASRCHKAMKSRTDISLAPTLSALANDDILHRYANEDTTIGALMMGASSAYSVHKHAPAQAVGARTVVKTCHAFF